MKRRVVSKPFFQGSFLALFLSLFRTEFICAIANSKLYFLLHGNRFAAKNACPTRGTQTLRSRVAERIISGND